MKMKNILALSISAMLLSACMSGGGLSIDTSTPEAQKAALASAETAFKENKPEKAVQILQALSDANNPEAQYQLAQMYRTGTGVLVDSKKYIGLLQKSANAGYLPALTNIGTLLLKNKDYQQAARIFQVAAQQGDIAAQYNLGLMMLRGDGVKKNEALALNYLQNAAQKGYPNAQYTVGIMLLQGQLVQKNPQQGIALIQSAARLGYVPAIKLLQQAQSQEKAKAKK